jgi:hypothetical protein
MTRAAYQDTYSGEGLRLRRGHCELNSLSGRPSAANPAASAGLSRRTEALGHPKDSDRSCTLLAFGCERLGMTPVGGQSGLFWNCEILSVHFLKNLAPSAAEQ